MSEIRAINPLKNPLWNYAHLHVNHIYLDVYSFCQGHLYTFIMAVNSEFVFVMPIESGESDWDGGRTFFIPRVNAK